MKKIAAVLLCAVALFGLGCQIPVPANEAKFGDMSFKFPKDIEITGLEVIKTGTRSFTLKATSWKSKNNPEVIQQSADGYVKIINATGDATAKTVGAAIEGAAKGAK